MALKLTYEDSLFNTGTYSIIHNGDEYSVDPVLFLKYSRKFAQLFNFNENHIEINDNYEKSTFDLFIKACQCQQIEIKGAESVYLLLLAEHWEATTLVTKIEEIIKTTIPAKIILELYNKFLGTDFPIERLEAIMTACLPRYVEEPLFPTLPYEVIDRIIHTSRAKIDPLQILKLCYAVADRHGLRSVGIVPNTSFDDLPKDIVLDVAALCEQCTNDGLAQFFTAMGHLLRKACDQSQGGTQFEFQWRSGEEGDWNVAYDFYDEICKYQIEQVRQEDGDEAAENVEPSATACAFLKIAADKGNNVAQYQYALHLMQNAHNETQRQIALNYMIQGAAESNPDAITYLKDAFPMPIVPTNMKQFVYSAYTLQNLLLNLNKRNINNAKSAIYALVFGAERDGITVIVSNLIRAAQIRQRDMLLLADLVFYLVSTANQTTNNYGQLADSLFSHIMETFYTEEPRAKQYALARFLYLLNQVRVYTNQDISDRLYNWMVQNDSFVQSKLILFYYFAPLLERSHKDVYRSLAALQFEEGMGFLDKIILDFKENLNQYKANDWEKFFKVREHQIYATELGDAICRDDLGKFQALTKEEDFDFNMKITNDIYDMGIDDTDELTLLQYTCIQGAQCIFTYLLQRGFVPMKDIDGISIICAIIGQRKFITDFIVTQMKEKDEVFRLAAEFQNVQLLSQFFKTAFPVANVDEAGCTALHHATERGLVDMVRILISLDGSDINKKDIEGYTALHIAAENNNIELVRILIVFRGIALDCRTNNQLLPYDLATRDDVKALLKKK